MATDRITEEKVVNKVNELLAPIEKGENGTRRLNLVEYTQKWHSDNLNKAWAMVNGFPIAVRNMSPESEGVNVTEYVLNAFDVAYDLPINVRLITDGKDSRLTITDPNDGRFVGPYSLDKFNDSRLIFIADLLGI